jgi:hypothetical protein
VTLAAAQPPKVQASIEPSEGITDDTTVLLVVEVEGGVSVGAPQLPTMTNLRVLSGPERRVHSSWVNGRFSSSSQYVYRLLPEGPGTAEIPPVTVTVDGRRHTTRRIRFSVKRSAPGTTQPRPRRPDAVASPKRADVSLRAEIGSREVWVGQSVPLSVTLYVNALERVGNASWAGQPALASFWVEDLEADPDQERYATSIQGRRYHAFPMLRKILVPQAPGEFEIEPYMLQLDYRARSSDPFDVFSFGRGQTIVRKTEPMKIRVRSLPENGRPEDFSGAVGSFTLKASLDRREAGVNDAVALSATIEGEGFLRSVAAPRLEAPADLKVFDPEVRSASRASRGRIINTKTWEWILVPLTPGEIQLPEIRFSYFDPDSGTYRVANQPIEPLVVRRSDRPGDAPLAHGDIQVQRRDLAFIKPLRGQLRATSPRVHQRGLFLTLASLPLVWVPVLVLVGRHRAKLQQNLGLARARKAGARARRRLRAAGRHAPSAEGASFHEEVARALVEYVADRFNRSAAGLTYELADELLASKGLDAELRRGFRSCLEACDFARFVPASGADERRAEVLAEANRLIDQLEKAW